MDQVVFGNYTVQDLLIAAAVVVGGCILISLLRKLLRGSPGDAFHQHLRCPRCGWQGQVSRYAGRCPQCNNPLGEQKAKPAGN